VAEQEPTIATAADRPAVRSLLVQAGLPVVDLDFASELVFWVVRDDSGRPIGAIGLERHGDVGLLRSLVVAPGQRSRGLGKTLVRMLEARANVIGLAQLVLLTETAEEFFRQLGYTVIDRDRAPIAVTFSAEFRTLCPSSAACMTKHLTPSH
jgi:N-acetylglutamate synthase-like GNAT family acetyltransferase